MKLTNMMRDSFIRAVMQDVPKKDFNDDMQRLAKEAVEHAMPVEIKVLLADKKSSRWVRWDHMQTPDGYISFQYYRPRESDYSWLTNSAPAYWKKMEALGKEKLAQDKVRQELESKIRSCAYSCTTLKQLRDMLPEFEKYMPVDHVRATKQYLPVANIVSDFVKAGWPKSKQNSLGESK